MMRGGPELDADELMAKANDAIEHAKWERWEEMFEIFDLHPGLPSWKEQPLAFNFNGI